MVGRWILYILIALLLSPIAFNAVFYFVEKDLEENPVSQNSVEEIVYKDGESLFAARCSSCHGANADGAGGYPRVNGEAAYSILSKLIGYKNGSYGSSAKGVMVLQVQDLSEEELKMLASYLAGLTPVLNEEETKKLRTIELDSFDSSS